MKEYGSIEHFKYDKSLLGEEVWGWNKLDGQNFRAKYSPKLKEFTSFGSRTQLVDETHEQFGDAVWYFKEFLAEPITKIFVDNSKKRGIFNSVQEIMVFCEYLGVNTFSGFHVEGESKHLYVIDVFLKKKGYIEQRDFYDLFHTNIDIRTPQIIYNGKLHMDFVNEIINNDWRDPRATYQNVKEGVVCKRSTNLKGQRSPRCKIKTQWWLDELMKRYPERYKELE